MENYKFVVGWEEVISNEKFDSRLSLAENYDSNIRETNQEEIKVLSDKLMF